MADVTFGLTQPIIEEEANWPPHISEPVNNERVRNFAASHGGGPVSNDHSAKVYEQPRDKEKPLTKARVPLSGSEAVFAPTKQPVSNDRTAVIHDSAHGWKDPQAPRSVGTVPNADVQILPRSEQPVSNEVGAGTIYHSKAFVDDGTRPKPVYEHKAPPGAFISNERNVTFAGAPRAPEPEQRDQRSPKVNLHTTPGININGDVHIASNHGHVSVGSTEVTTTPAEQGAMTANTDLSIGGGGDPTHGLRHEEIHIGAFGKPKRA